MDKKSILIIAVIFVLPGLINMLISCPVFLGLNVWNLAVPYDPLMVFVTTNVIVGGGLASFLHGFFTPIRPE